MATDYYAVLGVTPSAEDVVLDAARKALLRKYHPDLRPGEQAAARSRMINEAFRVLGDPASRLAYDNARSEAAAPPPTLMPSPAQLRDVRERALRHARERRRGSRWWGFILLVAVAGCIAALNSGERATGYGQGRWSDAALDYFCRS